MAAKPFVLDAAFAVLLTASVIAATAQFEPSNVDRSLDGIGYAVVVVACAAVALRRWRPLAVVIIVTAALCVYLVRNYVGGPVFVSSWIALFSLASTGKRRLALAASVVSAALIIGVGAVVDDGLRPIGLAFGGWAAVAVIAGDALESRRRRSTEIHERARFLELTRDEEVRRRIAEERLRIARDIHDSVAHSMATINVQAGAAAHVIDRYPEQAGLALVTIEQVSADLLEELSAILRVLRVDDTEPPSLVPTPGLDQIEDLVIATRRAGLDVELMYTERSIVVPRRVAVAAYRIVQESLTNVLRHAGATTATVTVTAQGVDGLVVEIVDNGHGNVDSSSRTGVGIIGMRERAEASGGILQAGPVPTGGFQVRATWAGR